MGRRLFGRQAFVGLTSDRYGTLTFGRQYDPLVDLVQGITADNYLGSVFATAGDVDNYDNSFRVDNAVKYTSAVYSGLQFSAMYRSAASPAAPAPRIRIRPPCRTATGRSASRAATSTTNSPASNTQRTGWTSSSDGTFDGPINSGYASAHSIGIARIAGQYVAGPFTVGLGYSNAQYRRDGSSVFGSNEHYNTGQGFVNYQATNALLVGVGYSYTRSGGDTSATYHQVSAGADYTLSKRTDVYLSAAYQHASGQTGDGRLDGRAGVDRFVRLCGHEPQTMVNLGLRHRF